MKKTANKIHKKQKRNQVLTALEEFKPEHPSEKERNNQKDIAEAMHAALEEEQGNLEGVEFPGMFG